MHILECLLALSAMAAVTNVAAAPRAQAPARDRCEPVDEAARRPDFFSFRARLQQAVAARDVDAVMDVVAVDIRISFGPENGIEAFKRQWRINDPDSPLWLALGTVLSLGGYFENPDAFVAPYTFRCGDGFKDVVVTGHNVNVRSAPSSSAAVLRTVSFAIVRGQAGSSVEGWSEVQLADGRKGYMASAYARSPIDYRAYFVRAGGSWRMAMFAAGD
jgi:hypothetical protein